MILGIAKTLKVTQKTYHTTTMRTEAIRSGINPMIHTATATIEIENSAVQ